MTTDDYLKTAFLSLTLAAGLLALGSGSAALVVGLLLVTVGSVAFCLAADGAIE